MDAIIGNPPFQSKNKMQEEFGLSYLNKLRNAYPEVSGMADYCVYWIYLSHKKLKDGCRAGLVGTNTIRQNQSRESGLDYVTANGGAITEAVSTQVWSGDAAVHVSIVNWIKGKDENESKKLFYQIGDELDSPWKVYELAVIPTSLTFKVDLTIAKVLKANTVSKTCYQGQTHGHEGFLLSKDEALTFIKSERENKEVLFPFLIADKLIGSTHENRIDRFAIDFHSRDMLSSKKFKSLFKIIEKKVLPDRELAAKKEEKRNKEVLDENPRARTNKHHKNFLAKWWTFSYPREELMDKLRRVPKYIACGRVTKRPIFEFVSSEINPNDALMAFVLADNYSFGILQSSIHWFWFVEKCSTLKGDFRYTSESVYETFPWPQSPSEKNVKAVAEASQELRDLRNSIMEKNSFSLRDIYKSLESPGKNSLRDAHEKLDKAVREAYGMGKDGDALKFLLDLNLELSNKENLGEQVVGPGLPPCVKDAKQYVTTDCVDINY